MSRSKSRSKNKPNKKEILAVMLAKLGRKSNLPDNLSRIATMLNDAKVRTTAIKRNPVNFSFQHASPGSLEVTVPQKSSSLVRESVRQSPKSQVVQLNLKSAKYHKPKFQDLRRNLTSLNKGKHFKLRAKKKEII